jgi:transcriptional regulator with XRE-family HTH domain
MGDNDEQAAAFMKALGAEIRSWRGRRNLSREELARRAGISATTMGRIEREGPVDVSHTWAIADVLGIPLATLVERAEHAVAVAYRDNRSLSLPGEEREQMWRDIDDEHDDLAARRQSDSSDAASSLDHLRDLPSAAAPKRRDTGQGDDDA